MRKSRAIVVIGLLTLIMSTSPIFFDIYRTAAFHAIPRDDYAPYLLTLLGLRHEIPGAPFTYRVLSVAVAIPFYYILPTYKFTFVPNPDPAYLKATEALSFVSYLSLVFTAVTIYAIARTRFCATKAASFIAALTTLFLSEFVARTGIDPFSILIISLLFLWMDNALVFVPLMIASIGINEKIPIIFATLLACRAAASVWRKRQFRLYPQLAAACCAVVAYFLLVHFVKAAGNEKQVDPKLFLAHMKASVFVTLALKGLVVNAMPIAVLLLVILFAYKYRQQNGFYRTDVSVLIVLLMLALFADVGFNIGRIVMYSYPLYLPAAGAFIDDALRRGTAV
jgi:hypothetical protein